ncbi:MAG: amidohydrolase family protein [Acidobacteria bacterium]|nr:amidohydrolase family protein [Acidobacteriota bacterium]
MLDLKIKGGTIIDGSGAEGYSADVGVKDGLIVETGSITQDALETLDAEGAIVTPGFVDIHTHYDGQITWDETLSPSLYNGVTTCVMGNCGVGFAPVKKGEEERLVDLMEGVEDIPGTALSEGVRWGWTSFQDYMNALDLMPHSIDYLVQVPHDPVRMFVMGARAESNEQATENDIAAMRDLVRQALEAGAAGFSTGRTDNHRTAKGRWTPSSEASLRELTGIAEAFNGLSHGVIQVVSDFDLLRNPSRFDEEFDLIESMAAATQKPLSMTWLQREPGAGQWKLIKDRAEKANQRGLNMKLQTAARAIGVINGLDASFHPFMGFPGYKSIAHLPLTERATRMRDPQLKSRILAEKSEKLAGDGTAIPPLVDILLSQIDLLAARMFPLDQELDYEPEISKSMLARAKMSGVSPIEAIYDYLAEGDGGNLIYFPIFNYGSGSLEDLMSMLNHPLALASLSDAGAHVGTVCDASFPTSMISFWTRDRVRGPKLALTKSIEMLTSRNARHLGLTDRGLLKTGLKADLNVFDYRNLKLRLPQLVRDLPAGGKRFIQRSDGYVATIVSGNVVSRNGQITEERPGRLVRLNQSRRQGHD